MIIRSARPESHFSIIANEIVRNPKLSYKARGILIELLSRPDNWAVSAESLARAGVDGRDSILSGLNELRNLGYIVTSKRRKENGQFETFSTVYDTPQITPKAENPTSVPESDKPESGNPYTENPTPLEVLSKKDYLRRTNTSNVLHDLTKLYFDNFQGEAKPSGGQIAGQIKILLKQIKQERLEELIPLVASEGMPLTASTINFRANKQQPKGLATLMGMREVEFPSFQRLAL